MSDSKVILSLAVSLLESSSLSLLDLWSVLRALSPNVSPLFFKKKKLYSFLFFSEELKSLTYGLLSGSLVRPKVVKSVHFCPSTGEFTNREYRDITSHAGLPTGSVYPTRVITCLLNLPLLLEGMPVPEILFFFSRMIMATYW